MPTLLVLELELPELELLELLELELVLGVAAELPESPPPQAAKSALSKSAPRKAEYFFMLSPR
ncbi:MAG TPA: hypothetical protein VLC92_14580 [Rhodocyclaceae bacterium]|nr:hypothetical protein [Rhodocyclaceae bacterium]